jgi:hypothetical protein
VLVLTHSLAARATFVPARGGNDKKDGLLGNLSKQVSVRDVAAHTVLKTRFDLGF